MATKLLTEIVINMTGNIANKSKQYGASVTKFAKSNQRAMAIIRRSTAGAGRALDRVGSRFTGMVAGGGMLVLAKQVGNTSAALTRMSTNTGLNERQMQALETQIRKTANTYSISNAQLIASTNASLSRNGNYQAALNNIDNMGKAIQGYGVSGEVAGKAFGDLISSGVVDARTMSALLDHLQGQFAVGSTSITEQFSQLPALLAMTAHKGKDAAVELTAIHQIFGEAFSTAPEATTAMKAFYSSFNDKSKIEFLVKQGVKVFKDGTEELLTPAQLLMNTLNAAEFRKVNLSEVFTTEAVAGLGKFAEVLEKSEFTTNLEKFQFMMGKKAMVTGIVESNALKNAAEFNNQLVRINENIQRIAYQNLATPVKELSEWLGRIDADKFNELADGAKNLAKAIVAVVVARKAWQAGSFIKSKFLAPKPGGGASKIFGLGVQKVYVVNMGGGFSPDGGGAGGGAKPTGKKISLFKHLFGSAAQLAKMTAVGLGVSMMPEHLPFDVRRAKDVPAPSESLSETRKNIYRNLYQQAGLLDVFDDAARLFSSDKKGQENKSKIIPKYRAYGTQKQQEYHYGTQPPPPLDGKIKVSVDISDNRKPRVKVSLRDLPGQSMAEY